MNFEEYRLSFNEKAVIVSLVCPKFEGHESIEESQASINEMKELLRTLEIPTGSEFIQVRKSLDPATMMGAGKLEEIAELCRTEKSNLMVFDFELSASQQRNIKEIAKMNVIDRNSVILEIFAKHARTKEAKIQIEISRLQYLLPRLTSMWTHLSKQRGGGLAVKGEGEQQIELDRRIIRERIEHHKRELAEIKIARVERSKKRKNMAITAALVGYTNAGKSSLMNRLCKVNVLEENKLFATLDSTYRTLNPDTKPPMILIDTVGFISNLPNTLIEGFKTTLESALEADLLIIVVDLSDPNYKKQMAVTEDVLMELGLENKERIIVFNKKDKIADPFMPKIVMRSYKASFLVSSYNEEDMKNLRQYILNYFLEMQEHYDLFIPYTEGGAHSKVRGQTNVMKSIPHEQGIFYRIRVPDFIFKGLGLFEFILKPQDPMTEIFKN